MSMEIGALARRIAERRGREALLLQGDILNQDSQAALMDVLFDALDADDLTADELDAALVHARAGKFFKSSARVAHELEQYRLSHFTAA